MLVVEFLIFIIALINYIVKKDLYLSSMIGMVLTLIYFIILGKLPLDIILYKTSIIIFLKVFIFFILILSFKSLYVAVSEKGIKDDLVRVFNVFFEDKKPKVLFLLIAGMLFYKIPLIGIILLIFLSLFLSFNIITATFMPFILISSLIMADAYLKVFLIESGKVLYIEYIILFYILMFIVVLLERILKNYKINFYDTLKDLVFYLFFLIINVGIFLFLDYLYSPFGALITSMILVTLIMIATLRYYKFFIIKDDEDETPVSSIFENLKLPYLTFIIVFLIYIAVFILATLNLLLGIIGFIVINFIISNRFLKIKYNHNQKETLKLFSIFVIAGILLIMLRYENININDLFTKLSDFYLLKSNQLQNVLYMSQNFTFIPYFSFNLNKLVNVLDYNEIWRVKVYLLIEMQLIMSFINVFIVGFIFKLSKKEIFYVSFILIAASLILQMVIYIN